MSQTLSEQICSSTFWAAFASLCAYLWVGLGFTLRIKVAQKPM